MFEIERSFNLRAMPDFDSCQVEIIKKLYIKQFYIEDCLPVIRLRRIEDQKTHERIFLMTVKEGEGLKRLEVNFETTERFASSLLMAAMRVSRLKKRRHVIKDEFGQIWEIDQFLSKLNGLVRAEIELKSEDQEVKIPDWFKELIVEEVTDDPTQSNFALARKNSS